MKKLSKKETMKQIEEFFQNIKEKSPEQVKKIKKGAASSNIRIHDKKKLFCKKCLKPYAGKEKIRIHKGVKSVECENCRYIARWKI